MEIGSFLSPALPECNNIKSLFIAMFHITLLEIRTCNFDNGKIGKWEHDWIQILLLKKGENNNFHTNILDICLSIRVPMVMKTQEDSLSKYLLTSVCQDGSEETLNPSFKKRITQFAWVGSLHVFTV